MADILVTGGAGFIGANFVHHWLATRPSDSVTVLDSLTYAGNRANLASLDDRANFHFVHGDIGDFELVTRLLAERAITKIVHFAAESHVDRSIHGPEAFVATNVVGTHVLLMAARDAAARGGPASMHFHHVSTDEVYGSLGPQDAPFTETSRYAPNSPYAASKAGSDHLVRAYHHTFGLRVTTTNCSNNYGPWQFPEKLLPLMIVRALSGEPLPLYGDGRNVRDWLHVDDHCRGIARVLDDGADGATYNIGGNNELENLDAVNMLCGAVDAAFAADRSLRERFPSSPAASGGRCAELVRFVPDRLGHDRRYAIDATRISKELGFSPSETFPSGLKKTVQWYLDNEPWWRSVLSGEYRDWIGRNYSI